MILTMSSNRDALVRRYKRDHPRVAANLPVELTMPGGDTIHALTVNVSPAGVQLACDRVTARAFFPGGQQAMPARKLEIDARLRFPESSGMPAIIEARCAAVFARRVKENEYRLGLQFLGFEGDGHRTLERFLEDQSYVIGG